MKNNKIDLSQYCTIAEYSKITGEKMGTISCWIMRLKAGQSVPDKGKIDFVYIPEIGKTLIKK